MMKVKSLTAPSALLAAFTLFSTPSFAEEREHGRQGREGGRDRSAQESSGRSAERAGPRRDAAAPRTESRSEAVSPRAESRREAVSPRAESRRDWYVQRAVPRREVIAPRYGYAPRYVPRYEPRYIPRYGYGVRSYYRPYAFRPRISIGFGIFAGYPVPYAYRYPYPVPVYGYAAPRGPVMIGPGSNVYGGIALEITPGDAAVYVDGTYAGVVADFDGSTQPLTLTGGTHRIDIEARGFAPLIFDVGVQAGQVIPYRGDLQPY